MCLNIVGPMLNASPTTALRLLTVSDGGAWDKAWAAAVGEHIYATSFHDGYFDQPAANQWTQAAVTTCAKRPLGQFIPHVWALRSSLNATGRNIAISADEWGQSQILLLLLFVYFGYKTGLPAWLSMNGGAAGMHRGAGRRSESSTSVRRLLETGGFFRRPTCS